MADRVPFGVLREGESLDGLHYVNIKMDKDDMACLDQLRSDMQLHRVRIVTRSEVVRHCVRQMHILTFGEHLAEKQLPAAPAVPAPAPRKPRGKKGDK